MVAAAPDGGSGAAGLPDLRVNGLPGRAEHAWRGPREAFGRVLVRWLPWAVAADRVGGGLEADRMSEGMAENE